MASSDQSGKKAGAVSLTGRLICADLAQAEIVSRYLPEHIRLTRSEPGCLFFDVRPTDDPLVWSVEERFVGRTSFDAHQARTKSSEWAVATADIRRDYTITELTSPV